MNFSRALWRPSGQNGPSLHRVINEAAFKKKGRLEGLMCVRVCGTVARAGVMEGIRHCGTRKPRVLAASSRACNSRLADSASDGGETLTESEAGARSPRARPGGARRPRPHAPAEWRWQAPALSLDCHWQALRWQSSCACQCLCAPRRTTAFWKAVHKAYLSIKQP